MKSPSSGSCITQPWVEFVLQQYEAKANAESIVTLTSFEVSKATKPGESFNAELVKVDAVAKLCTDGKTQKDKEYSFIAKFLVHDPISRESIKIVGYHVREYTMYSQMIPELNKHWEEHAVNKDMVDHRLHVPGYMYGVCNQGEYVVVLENCKAIGFESNDKHKGLDFEQTMMAVNHLARLHALSYSYNQTSPITDKYPALKSSYYIGATFKPLVLAVLENTIRFLKTIPERAEMLAKLEKSRHTIPLKFQTMWADQSRHQLLCLTHGDFWNSNLLFQYAEAADAAEERRLKEMKILDWQISQWSNPVFDLHYLLNTSTRVSMRQQHQDTILHHYHATFTTITESLNTTVPDWNYDQFLAEFGRTSLVGFMMGMCLIQGTLSKEGEKLNVNNTTSSAGDSKGVLYKIKSAAAKVMVPLVLKPSSYFILKSFLRKVFAPIGQELIDGKNTIMNERLLEHLDEADAKGLIDVLCL